MQTPSAAEVLRLGAPPAIATVVFGPPETPAAALLPGEADSLRSFQVSLLAPQPPGAAQPSSGACPPALGAAQPPRGVATAACGGGATQATADGVRLLRQVRQVGGNFRE